MANRSFRYDEHFMIDGSLGAAAAAGRYSKVITGSGPPTVKGVTSAGQANGILQLALEATSEVQNACAYNGDVLYWDIRNILYAEFVARLSVTLGTTASTTQWAFGLATARNDAIASISKYILFRALGGTSVIISTSDGTTTNSSISTGLTMGTVNTTFKRFGFDFRGGLNNVKCYMDDANGKFSRVGQATTIDMSAFTSGGVQFFAQIQKAANTNVGTLEIDRFSLEFREPT